MGTQGGAAGRTWSSAARRSPLLLLLLLLGAVLMGLAAVQAFVPPVSFRAAEVRPASAAWRAVGARGRLGMAAGQLSLEQQQKLPDLSQRDFPDIPDEPYDLVVLGSGPAGETASCKAAQLGAKVAIIEVKKAFGGPTGLTSKAVREAAKRIIKTVDQVGGDRDKQIRRLWAKRFPALKSEAEVFQAAETRDRLNKNACDLYIGSALMVKDTWDPDNTDYVTVRVCRPTGCVELQSRYVVIATGSRACRPATLRNGVTIPYTSRKVIDATQMANLKQLPESLAVIGGGVISIEYATVFASLGVPTALLCREEAFLPFLPEELRGAIKAEMARDGIQVIHSDVQTFTVDDDGKGGAGKQVRFAFDDGGQLAVDLCLYSGGRDANSEKIGCENVGVGIGKYGRVLVDRDFRTANPRIFAIGDVVGPPGLASFAQQAARVVTDLLFRTEEEEETAAEEAAKRKKKKEEEAEANKYAEATLEDWADDDFFLSPVAATIARTIEEEEEEEERERARSIALLKRMEAPLTLWTIPEVSSSGLSVEEALAQGERVATPEDLDGTIVFGYGYFKDMARGRLSGDLNGFLKIIARAEGPTRHVIVGVHVVGDGANELIQLGSVLVHSRTTLEELSNTPFAAVTLSCLYQVASDDALCRSPFSKLRKPDEKQQQQQQQRKEVVGATP